MISSLAVVQTDLLGEGVTIAEFAVIRPNVTLGNSVVIHPHVVISEGVSIGDGVEVFPGAFLGKEPKGAGATSRPIEFQRRLVIGNKTSIGPHAVVYYDVEIGQNVLVGDGVSIREKSIIGDYTVVGRYATLNYNCRVGSRVKIMDHAWLAGNMLIEDDVFVSGGVLTANDNSIGQASYQEHRIRGPILKRGAAIGVGAILLPGVTVGEGAVVAAGAVVTHDVAHGITVFGIPARTKTNSTT